MPFTDTLISRRQALISTTKILAGIGAAPALVFPVLTNASGQALIHSLNDTQINTITLLSRYMFPHQNLDKSYYLAVAQHIDQQIGKKADLAGLVQQGIKQLDDAAGGSWLDADQGNKMKAMHANERGAFFALVLNTSIDLLYRHPDVWKLVGYEGSSFEHGGYLNRGFDDIDWLEE